MLAGAEDPLVPWAASRAFVEALEVGEGGRKVVRVMPGVKHEFTDGMREEMFEFFWEEALVGSGGGGGGGSGGGPDTQPKISTIRNSVL